MGGWGAIYNNMSYALQNHTLELARLQEQTASGARVNRPSDDPTDAYQIMRLRSQSKEMQRYIKNLDMVQRDLELSQGVLTEMSTLLNKAQSLVTQGASGTYKDHNRHIVAEEIDSILEQCLSIANTQSLGRYIFGGSATGSAPYAATRESGKITSVSYQGSHEQLPVPVGPGVQHTGLMVGETIFKADHRQTPVFHGNTGLTAGSGTSSVTGDVWLTARHTATVYTDPGGTGVAAAANHAGRDTILGDHTLTVDMDANQIRLDDGVWVSMASGSADLWVTNGSGDGVHVDVSSLNAVAGTHTIALAGQGALSINGGADETALTSFDANIAVADSATGRVLMVGATNVTRVGSEPVRVPGTYDVFQTLVDVRDLLKNTRNIPEQKQIDMLAHSIDSVKEAMTAVTNKMTAAGGRLQAMENLGNTLADIRDNATMQMHSLEDADLTEVAAGLARTQTLYEMTLAVSARVLSLSLLQYLR